MRRGSELQAHTRAEEEDRTDSGFREARVSGAFDPPGPCASWSGRGWGGGTQSGAFASDAT